MGYNGLEKDVNALMLMNFILFFVIIVLVIYMVFLFDIPFNTEVIIPNEYLYDSSRDVVLECTGTLKSSSCEIAG